MKIYAIAVNTFKEAIRDKIFYSLVFFAGLIIGTSILLSMLTLGEGSKIIADISLAGINFFGVIISIFVGIGLVYKELEKKTIYTIISKPIRRSDFLLGKYLGLALTLLVYLSVMSAIFLAVLYIYTGSLAYRLLLVRCPHLFRTVDSDRRGDTVLHFFHPVPLGYIHACHLRNRPPDRRPQGACGENRCGIRENRT